MNKIREIGTSATGIARVVVRIFRLIWPEHKWIIAGYFAVSMVLSVMPFLRSGTEALLINELVTIAGKSVSQKIFWLVVFMIAVSLFGSIINSLSRFASRQMWINVREFLEKKFLKKKSEIDVATYENPKFNDLLNKADDHGVSPIIDLVGVQFENIQNVVQMIISAGVFLVFDWRFFVLSTLAALPDFFVETKYGKSTWGIYNADAQTKRRFWSVKKHFNWIERLIELKIFQNVTKFYNLAEEMLRGFNDKQRKLNSSVLKWRLAAGLTSSSVQAVMLVWIIYMVAQGDLKIGTMTFILASIGRFQGALRGFFVSLARQFEWSLYAKNSFEVLDTESVITVPYNAVCVSDERPPEIVFENVSFAYPETDRLILKDLNLKIMSGERFAIIGLNGAGKSTLIKLIMRFYDPTGGRILVNGTDLRFIDLESWYSCVSALFQDYATYNFPVEEVIALGRSNAKPPLSKVVKAAKAADAHEFIKNWKDRYSQMIGKEFDNGINPSEGQLQKIALARSFYRNPRLMILDEPTASIDASAEAKIFEQLDAESTNRTQIVISHRFSTVRRSDRICVLEDGTISELGTHAELMVNDKTYAQLFRLQAKGYE